MPQIRIKKAPQMGDQRDFSLFDRRTMNPGPTDTSDQVQNTMGPVPRNQASIEVERGEVVIGDTNQDGFLELFTFTGKPHSKGGTPVDIPQGSFIYSNTRKLRIKDPEVLSKVFGLSPNKQGYTPADIAKKYQINQYVADLKNETADNITKRSANQMLQNNLNKLGMLALIQESMKGFPDGIPAIAESAAIGLGMNPQAMQKGEGPESMENPNLPDEPEMGQARYGGLAKFQPGGTNDYFQQHIQEPKLGSMPPRWWDFDPTYLSQQPVKKPDHWEVPVFGTTFYKDDFIPVTVVEADPQKVAGNWASDPFTSPYIKLSDGTTMSQAEYMYMMGTGSNRYKGVAYNINDLNNNFNSEWERQTALKVNQSLGAGRQTTSVITTKPVIRTRAIPDQYGNPTSLNISTGDNLKFRGTDYKVINPYGEFSPTYRGSGKRVADSFDDTHGIILVQNLSTGEYDYIEGEDLGDTYKIYPQGIGVTKGVHIPGETNTQQVQQNYDGAANSVKSQYGNAPVLNGNRASGTQGQPAQQVDNNELQRRANAMGWYTIDQYKNSGWKSNDELLKNAQNMGWGNDIIGYRDANWARNQNAPAASAPAQAQVKAPATNSAPAKKTQTASKPAASKTKVYTADDFKTGGEYTLPHYVTTFEYGGSYSHDGLPKHQTTGPVQERYIGPSKSGTGDKYEQANGDIYIREKGTGKILAIQHKNGDVSTVYGDRVERVSNGGKGTIVDISAPEPTQAWHDIDWKGKYMDDAAQFEKIWNGPNSQPLKDAMYEEFKKIAAASPNSKELLAMKPEEALGYMLEGNKQNSMIQSAYADQPEYLQSKRWDQANVNKFTDASGKEDSGKNLYYRKAAEKLGLKPQSDIQTQAFQAMYQAAQRVARQPEYMEHFKDFDINPVGVADQQTMGEAVSPVEGWRGNTTIGQLGRLKENITPPEKEIPEKEIPEKEIPKQEEVKEQTPLPQEPRKPISWWLPDIMNFTGAVTDQVHRFEPMLQQLDLKTPGYDTENYDTMVNNARGQQREYQTMLENTVGGPQAAAAALGTNNFEGITNAIAGVQARNVATVNGVAANNANIENQERLANVNGRDKYMTQMATLGQQQANDEQKKKWREIGTFNNGTENWYKHKQMEQVLFPQVHVDSINGDVSFSGNGRNPLGPDTYQNPYTSAHGAGAADDGAIRDYAMKAYSAAKKAAIDAGYEEEDAKKMAERAHARIYNMATPTATNRQQYMNAMLGNMSGAFGANAATSPFDFEQ